eukprot:4356187-Prymnesium_polylepis.1
MRHLAVEHPVQRAHHVPRLRPVARRRRRALCVGGVCMGGVARRVARGGEGAREVEGGRARQLRGEGGRLAQHVQRGRRVAAQTQLRRAQPLQHPRHDRFVLEQLRATAKRHAHGSRLTGRGRWREGGEGGASAARAAAEQGGEARGCVCGR